MIKWLLPFMILLCAYPAYAQSPIACNANFYHSRYHMATNSTYIYRVTPSPYTETLFATAPSGMRFDALAYNTTDGLLYAVLSQPYNGNPINALVQIDNLGTITIPGSIAGLAPTGWTGGTFDSVGNLWVTSDTTSTLFKIDVNLLQATGVPVGQTVTNAGDLAYNPLDNLLYLTTLDARLYKINPSTGAASVITLSNGTFDASFFDGAGQLYGYDRNGNFAKIDKVTGAVTTLNTTASISEGDAASCPLYVPVTRPIINLSEIVTYLSYTVPGIDLTYRTRFTNNGTRDAYNVSIVQVLAEYTDFKLNSVYVAAPPNIRFTIEYSSNLNRRTTDYLAAAAVANWTYQPISGGGGAEDGYDRRVRGIRIRTSDILTYNYPHNEGVLQYLARIQ